MLQAVRSQIWFPMKSLNLSIYLILSVSLWPWGELSFWYKWVPGIFLGLRAAGAQGWKPHRRLWADCVENVGASTSHNPMDLHGLLQR
jgi:hypothetical protein